MLSAGRWLVDPALSTSSSRWQTKETTEHDPAQGRTEAAVDERQNDRRVPLPSPARLVEARHIVRPGIRGTRSRCHRSHSDDGRRGPCKRRRSRHGSPRRKRCHWAPADWSRRHWCRSPGGRDRGAGNRRGIGSGRCGGRRRSGRTARSSSWRARGRGCPAPGRRPPRSLSRQPGPGRRQRPRSQAARAGRRGGKNRPPGGGSSRRSGVRPRRSSGARDRFFSMLLGAS
jgi:hypothetical protein